MVRAKTPANHTPRNTADPAVGNYRQQLLAYALAYADAGWPIFPLRPGTKRPATPDHTATDCGGTDPRCTGAAGHQGWEQRATTNHGRIQRAWAEVPYGIGIACGPAGLIVIDLDTGPHDGPASLRQLEHDHQRLPATFTVATPSGGRHLYYQRPTNSQARNSAGTVAPGIDIRTTGGYIAAPPTNTPNGTYEVVDDHWPVALPQWFSQLLTSPKPTRPTPAGELKCGQVDRYVQAAVAGEVRKIHTAPEGQRNHTLFCASVALGQLTAADAIPQSHAEDLLAAAAASHVQAGAYTHSEAVQTIASGLRRGLAEPRQLPNQTAGAGR